MAGGIMRVVEKWLYWLFPPLFCVYLYWYALNGWFQQDDFVWLGLLRSVHGAHDLFLALFKPTIHGTWRPWSDRAFFLAFRALFGLQGLPYHIWIFLTQFANLALISHITWRLTGSRLAGFCAPLFWIGNAALVMAMSLACLYKDILCSFFLLLAFYFFLRHIETGARRYYVWQWVAFVLGFGAMETNLVYPAIAASYALLCARPYLRKTLPLFIPSIAFVALNMILVARRSSGPYSIHIDWLIPVTFSKYWIAMLVPLNLEDFTPFPEWSVQAGAIVITLALAAFVAWQGWRRNWLPAFFLAWFVIALAPVLPLREQFWPYYATAASIGLAMLAAYAISIAIENRRRMRWLWRTVAVVLMLVFLAPSVTVARAAARWWYDRSVRVRNVVTGVAEAAELHPGKTIVLDGVDNTLFWAGVWYGGFRAADLPSVYLAPGSESRITPDPSLGGPQDFILSAPSLRAGLKGGQVKVFSVDGDRLTEVTRSYLRRVLQSATLSEDPLRIDFASPLIEPFLGVGWYPAEERHRWMAQKASVRLSGPRNSTQTLHLTGFCPAAQVRSGPLLMIVAADGKPMKTAPLREGAFDVSLPLSPDLVGKKEIEVTIRVDRTFRPPNDARDLGLSFGVVEIR
jgi:hypothetical protein